MNKCWRVCLLVLAVVAGVGHAGAQENPDRIAAIMRDMDRRSAGNSLEPSAPIVPVIQVSATQPAWQPTPQSVIEDQPSGIPEYLLPQVYSSDSLGMNQPVSSVQEIQQQPLGDRFMFSSAFQRRINPPKGNFGNVADDCGCCDEWQTFMPCESCCRDLGLNPWVFQRARPNCPPHWWLHPNRSAECEGCNSGSCGGACGETKSHGWFKHSSW